MVRELSGSPNSCATPAANNKTDDVRSLSMRASVVCLSRVISDKITANRVAPRPTLPAKRHHIKPHGSKLRISQFELTRENRERGVAVRFEHWFKRRTQSRHEPP